MKSEQELIHMHNIFRKILDKIMQEHGFEVTLAVFRKLLRTDYHSITKDDIPNLISENIDNDYYTIRIDTQTPKQVYKKIIDDIYADAQLTSPIKDTKKMSKENKLMIIFNIYFYSQYLGFTKQQIEKELPVIENFDTNKAEIIEKKEISRILTMIHEIKSTNNINTPPTK